MSYSLQPYGLWTTRLLCTWDSPGKNTGVGCHALLQGIFPTQGWNLCLLHLHWQLPIYTAPPLQSKYVEEQPGHLQMGFASIRTTTSRYIGWCKGVYVFVKNGIMDTVQFGKDAYVYLKNPPRDFLPKIGVITVSGLAGFISARKGSRFKRIAYPLGLATLGATVCYPVQSVIIAKVAGKKAYATSQQMYEAVKSLWTKNNKKLPEHKEKTKLGSADETETPAETTHNLKHSVPLPAELSSETKTKSTSGATQFMPDPKLMDHGQSHPEDIDMYSTRS
uniref:MICOS complex subunit n=1 Tax=Bos taurus TaxID=9913 RepID=A0AAA9TT95_BOVIN